MLGLEVGTEGFPVRIFSLIACALGLIVIVKAIWDSQKHGEVKGSTLVILVLSIVGLVIGGAVVAPTSTVIKDDTVKSAIDNRSSFLKGFKKTGDYKWHADQITVKSGLYRDCEITTKDGKKLDFSLYPESVPLQVKCLDKQNNRVSITGENN